MKSTILHIAFVLSCVLPTDLWAQVPDSLLDYYPFHFGDVWQYQSSTPFGPTGYSITEIVRDTVTPNGHRYWIFENGWPRMLRIDSLTGCVYEIDPSYGELQFDSLLTPDGGRFLYGMPAYDSHLGATVWFRSDTVLGIPSTIRTLYGPQQSVTYYIARGFGIVMTSATDDLPPFGWTLKLVYAKINGVEYGTRVAVSEPTLMPSSVQLRQNYPNPFNPSTTIEYYIPQLSSVDLTVVNTIGQTVAQWRIARQSPGVHTVTWTPNLATGVYLCRLEVHVLDGRSESFLQTRRMLLLR